MVIRSEMASFWALVVRFGKFRGLLNREILLILLKWKIHSPCPPDSHISVNISSSNADKGCGSRMQEEVVSKISS